MVLSTREKALIGVLVALLVGLGVYMGVGGVREHLRQLENGVAVRESMLTKATALVGEVERMQKVAAPRRAARSGSLIATVEQMADRIGVKDRIQLNLIPRESSTGLQALDIKVAQLTLDEMVNFLYTLEDSDERLVIDQFELSPSFRNKDRLRLSMRVLARE